VSSSSKLEGPSTSGVTTDLDGHSNDGDLKDETFCICNGPDKGSMICCDNDIKIMWFHLNCLKISEKSIPKGKWYCLDCQKNSKRKGKSSKKSTDHVLLLHSCNINNYVIQKVQQIHKHCLRHSHSNYTVRNFF